MGLSPRLLFFLIAQFGLGHENWCASQTPRTSPKTKTPGGPPGASGYSPYYVCCPPTPLKTATAVLGGARLMGATKKSANSLQYRTNPGKSTFATKLRRFSRNLLAKFKGRLQFAISFFFANAIYWREGGLGSRVRSWRKKRKLNGIIFRFFVGTPSMAGRQMLEENWVSRGSVASTIRPG